MYFLILFTLFNAGGIGAGNNDPTSSVAGAAFKNKASCEVALAAVVAKTDGAVDGICVARKVKKVK